MKRRNVDSSKARRPVKKIPKIYDGFYTSLVVYVKLILLWICVMGGDFILEFRLEYLYPIYLLLHNSYEAYKFQGLAFALLLICIVVSVDVICLGVIPAPWLYLLGSLAVWGQVGWNLTPLGPLLLLPTLIYIDGKSIRPLPSQPLSPLAAHCVGFPLVSLGFGLKSFIGARLKQRTRNDVARQNELLYSLLWEALPLTSTPVNNNEVINGGPPVLAKKQQSPQAPRRKSLENGDGSREPSSGELVLVQTQNGKLPGAANGSSSGSSNSSSSPLSSHHNQNNHHNNHNHSNHNSSSGGASSTSPIQANSVQNHSHSNSSNHNNSNHYATPCPTCAAALLAPKKKKDDCCLKVESEVRKLRSDLHVVRTIESELRGQIASLLSSERNLRSDLASLQGEHESLQLKYSALLSKSQEERQSYEKKLQEERRLKENAISKQKKASSECSGDCRRKLREADREKESLRREIKVLEDKNMRIERELQNVKSTLLLEQKNKECSAEAARLRSLLTSLQDQNAHLESSLSAETRLKLDLFSALGEARRQLSIRENLIKSKEEELEDVRSQYVELLAVSDFTHHQHRHQQQQQQQQSLQRQHSQTPQQQHQAQQSQQSHRLKMVGVGESSPQQVGRENLTYTPLIES
ncbi:unnamed protein product [Orchesella dallaii]|uniref:Macoilin n=1 Tax=Orchesella dallaii TaxID=48710 RepID=A0ABP1RCS5_9HEXA